MTYPMLNQRPKLRELYSVFFGSPQFVSLFWNKRYIYRQVIFLKLPLAFILLVIEWNWESVKKHTVEEFSRFLFINV